VFDVVDVFALAKKRALDVIGVCLIAASALDDVTNEAVLLLDERFVPMQWPGKLFERFEDLLPHFAELSGDRGVLGRQVLKPVSLGMHLRDLDPLFNLLDLAFSTLDLNRVVLDRPLELLERVGMDARLASPALHQR